MQLWLCPLLAFLLGSIPFGLLIAKAKGIDIRQHGSNNIGATNVLRVVGKRYGIACFLLDALKGFLPVAVALSLIRFGDRDPNLALACLKPFACQLPSDQQTFGQFLHVLTGMMAILGHNYSPWVGFKGGKGIATSAGVLLGLYPFFGVLLLALVWLVLFLSTRYVSIASIGAAAALPVVTHLGARFHHLNNNPSLPTLWQAGTWNKPLFAFTVAISALAIWKHRANIQRLRAGTEHRFVRKTQRSKTIEN